MRFLFALPLFALVLLVAGPASAQRWISKELLVEVGDPSPIPDESIVELREIGAVAPNGSFAYTALTGLPIAPWVFVFFDPNGQTLIARDGDPTPGVPGGTFSNQIPFFDANSGNVQGDTPVTANSGDLLYRQTGAALELYRAAGDPAPAPFSGTFSSVGLGCLADDGRMFFSGGVGSAPETRGFFEQESAASAPAVLIRDGDPVPGTSTGTYGGSRGCRVDADGALLVGFTILNEPGVFQGVFWRAGGGTAFVPVVLHGDPFPGGGSFHLPNPSGLSRTRFSIQSELENGTGNRHQVGEIQAGVPCCLADFVSPGQPAPGGGTFTTQIAEFLLSDVGGPAFSDPSVGVFNEHMGALEFVLVLPNGVGSSLRKSANGSFYFILDDFGPPAVNGVFRLSVSGPVRTLPLLALVGLGAALLVVLLRSLSVSAARAGSPGSSR